MGNSAARLKLQLIYFGACAYTFFARGLNKLVKFVVRIPGIPNSLTQASLLNCARAFNYRGGALLKLRRLKDALGFFDWALSMKPDCAEAFYRRGVALLQLERFEPALASFDRALAIKSDHPKAFVRRGYALFGLFRLDESLASCNHALEMHPNNAKALALRSTILKAQGKIEEAVSNIRRALVTNPDNADLHTNLIFQLNLVPSVSAAEKHFERAEWNRRHADRFRRKIRPHKNGLDQHRRLRIGYVSSHFRRHTATYAFGGVLVSHDRNQFEVVCYSGTKREDDVTAKLRSRADKWRHTVGLSDEHLAKLVRSDRIDILVDLVGHMGGHRLGVFARKPAPIQVTAWGEPTGTGLKAMDYLLADPVLVTESERALLVERVVDLPNFLGYWHPTPLPECGSPPALNQGCITFGSFNRLEKITKPTICAWAAILRKLPTSRLILKDRFFADPAQRMRIERDFAAEGILPKRLTLLGKLGRDSHLSAYGMIDIALDPVPHSGGMTTLDALWMGVPVITWPGQTISSRLAAACLSASGLTDFIANSAEAYVDLAVSKASNLESLSRLRAKLRAHLVTSEFGDSKRYCRAVEAAYRKMWQNWCSAPASHLD